MAKKPAKKQETVTANQLASAVAERMDLTKKQAQGILNAFYEEIIENLQAGSKVRTGLGIFQIKKRAKRKGRNPQTGEEISIPAKTVPKFSFAKPIKDLVK